MHDNSSSSGVYFTRFAQSASIAVIVIGCLVIAGWAFDIAALRSVFPGFTPMNPGGTALAFILAGISLWLQAPPDAKPKQRLPGRLCAAGVLLIALTRIGGYLLGWRDGPDRWLFPDELSLEALRSGYLNVMAPNTAAAFLLTGLALLCLDVKIRRIRPAQALALACIFIALLTIAGYIYGAVAPTGMKPFIPMALNTAIAFVFISVGILFARHDHGTT